MYLISFQYFVHPYGVAFSARYRVLINTMCLWIYCCGMAVHIWWISRVSFLRFVCRGCARTLRFNRSNKWSIGFNSRLFASHVCMLFAASIINVLLAVWHDAWSRANTIPRLARIWRRRRTDPMTSFRSYVKDVFSSLLCASYCATI